MVAIWFFISTLFLFLKWSVSYFFPFGSFFCFNIKKKKTTWQNQCKMRNFLFLYLISRLGFHVSKKKMCSSYYWRVVCAPAIVVGETKKKGTRSTGKTDEEIKTQTRSWNCKRKIARFLFFFYVHNHLCKTKPSTPKTKTKKVRCFAFCVQVCVRFFF